MYRTIAIYFLYKRRLDMVMLKSGILFNRRYIASECQHWADNSERHENSLQKRNSDSSVFNI